VARPVLVVDDDDFGRQTLGRILEAVGYSVLQAADGAEALRRLRRTPPAGLIILDLLMPGFDGWQFFEEQRSDPRLADIPVLVVSAVRPTEPRACFPGIVGHFAKPIAVPALLETVRRHWQPR
jgi:CheY-like chemotaxis protein